MVRIQAERGDTDLAIFDYKSIDGLGRRKEVDETLKPSSGPNISYSVTYGYDRLSRLLNENRTKNGSPLLNDAYAYDDVGNRTQKDAVSYTYYANSDKLQSDGTLTYQYDQNWNMTARGNDSFSYDFENRLKTADALDQTTDFIYGPDGNRVRKEVDQSVEVQYIVDANRAIPEVLVELDGNENVTSVYVYGDDLICRHPGPNTSSPYYYFSDAIGSTRLITDASGNVKNRYTYDAFGSTLADEWEENVENNRLFTGQTYDAAPGFVYLRARYYDPAIGRFTAIDPVRGTLTDPRTLHPYSYCGSDPVNCSDPSGEYTILQGIMAHGQIQDMYVIEHMHHTVKTDLPVFGSGLRPDIRDYTMREVYEIRPNTRPYGRIEGPRKLSDYLDLLNRNEGGTGRWRPGIRWPIGVRTQILVKFPLDDLIYWNEGGMIYYDIVPRAERYALAKVIGVVYASYRIGLQIYMNIAILNAQLGKVV